MLKRCPRRRSLRLESLEERLVMSLPPGADTYGLTPPANTISLSLGDATRPGAASATTATVVSRNITVGKASTEFGVFVQPYGDSGIVPKVVGVEENGRRIPFQIGRPYNAKLAPATTADATAFFEASKPGTVTILVSGVGLSTGQYTVETTLIGDVNGDGTVTIADLEPFAKSYAEKLNQSDYNAAADYNQDGIVNEYDALMMEGNMTALRKPGGPWTVIHLAPQDSYATGGPTDSGGVTIKEDVVIDGYTTPGSIVLQDSSAGDYTFGAKALPTTTGGFYTTTETNSQGVNTYNFKVLDPYGHQYIRSFPVYWTTYAEPNSPYHYTPSKKSTKGQKIA